MDIAPIPSYAAYSKQYILEQYKDSSKLLGTIHAIEAQLDTVEAMLWELADIFSIDRSIGVQLDIIGDLLGISRDSGEVDATYRARLLSGSGSTLIPSAPGIRDFVQGLTTAAWVGIYPQWPAGYWVVISANNAQEVTEAELETVSGSGVQPYNGTWLVDKDGAYILGSTTKHPLVVQRPTGPVYIVGFDQEGYALDLDGAFCRI